MSQNTNSELVGHLRARRNREIALANDTCALSEKRILLLRTAEVWSEIVWLLSLIVQEKASEWGSRIVNAGSTSGGILLAAGLADSFFGWLHNTLFGAIWVFSWSVQNLFFGYFAAD